MSENLPSWMRWLGEIIIITHKAQTTRHVLWASSRMTSRSSIPIRPYHEPHYLLHKACWLRPVIDLRRRYHLLMTDVNDPFEHEDIIARLKEWNFPSLFLSIKLTGWPAKWGGDTEMEDQLEMLRSSLCLRSIASILRKSFETILDKLPENPPFFPKDETYRPLTGFLYRR